MFGFTDLKRLFLKSRRTGSFLEAEVTWRSGELFRWAEVVKARYLGRLGI